MSDTCKKCTGSIKCFYCRNTCFSNFPIKTDRDTKILKANKKRKERQIDFYIKYIEKCHIVLYRSEFVTLSPKWYKRLIKLTNTNLLSNIKFRMKRELLR